VKSVVDRSPKLRAREGSASSGRKAFDIQLSEALLSFQGDTEGKIEGTKKTARRKGLSCPKKSEGVEALSGAQTHRSNLRRYSIGSKREASAGG